MSIINPNFFEDQILIVLSTLSLEQKIYIILLNDKVQETQNFFFNWIGVGVKYNNKIFQYISIFEKEINIYLFFKDRNYINIDINYYIKKIIFFLFNNDNNLNIINKKKIDNFFFINIERLLQDLYLMIYDIDLDIFYKDYNIIENNEILLSPLDQYIFNIIKYSKENNISLLNHKFNSNNINNNLNKDIINNSELKGMILFLIIIIISL